MHSISTLVLALVASASAIPTSSSTTTHPPPQNNETCTDKVRHLTAWTAANISYSSNDIFTTPAHQVASGSISFVLENPALTYAVNCHAYSTQLNDFFYGWQVYHCAVPGGYSGDVSFTYNRPGDELKINQTWSCPEEGSTFRASGGAVLGLKCRRTQWQNTNWTTPSNGFYSTDTVSCDPLTASIPIAQISATL